QAADMIFGIGGGKAVDTCKALAYQIDKPLFTFPTVCSNCASSTQTCIMYYPDHTMREMYYPKRCARHVFINTAVIADSPAKYMWAGIGDALAKEYETELVSRADIKDLKMTHSPYLGIGIAKCCTQPLLKYGEKTMEQMEKKEPGYELEQVALAVIITAGLASILNADPLERFYYNTCIAHCFYNAYTVTSKAHEHLHGEVVSYGILVQLAYDKNYDELAKLLEFYKALKLPTTMADVELDPSEVKLLVDQAEKMVEWPYIPGVTKENFTAAILDEDKFAKEWMKANA
ncbi:MAG: iron-containing alcohol dehydrogenase, partial [Eubacteriales bacterium]|nr:iron-containing alcohol dehydrogenase [Eubacteriales bacterium]